jgi:DNA polymerase-1
MEYLGFSYDGNALSEVSRQIDLSINAITTEVYMHAGEEFNLNSPKQLGIVLFENMGIKYSGKKTARGGYSTSVDVLEKLAPYHPIIPLILKYRTLAKLRSTYIEGLAPLVAADGKIHAHFRQTVTATGRISCTEPNLQNIPIRQELGREIRRAFVTESEEFTLLGADYSQIELRVLAHLSQDEGMIADFKTDADIHRRTASRVFGVKEDEVTPQQRSAAKVVNFGIIYGMSSFGLSEDLGITPKQAANYIADYFEQHKAVKDYLDNSVADAKKLGYSKTLLGRKRAIPELNSPMYQVRQFGERLAMNTPIQGGAADIMKLAMIKVSEALREAKMKSTLILQVHEELILQVYKPELEAAKKLLREGMESVIELSVPLLVSMNTGDSWYELK